MSIQRTIYVMLISIAAFALSIPQLYFVLRIASSIYAGRGPGLPMFPGIGPTCEFGGYLEWVPVWNNKFVCLTGLKRNADDRPELTLSLDDPVSNTIEKMVFSIDGKSNMYQQFTCGEHLWMIGNRDSFEYRNGAWELATDAPSIPVLHNSDPPFFWNGSPAILDGTPMGHFLTVWKDGCWSRAGTVALPESDNKAKVINGVNVPITVQVLQSGGELHVFVCKGAQFFYRKGLQIAPSPADQFPKSMADDASRTRATSDSLQSVGDATPDSSAWSSVREINISLFDWRGGPRGLMIDRQPAALILDRVSNGDVIGTIYRFDGTNWTEHVSQAFPFGTTRLRAVVIDGGARSLIVATTSNGIERVYTVDASGIEETRWRSSRISYATHSLWQYLAIPTIALILGLVFASIVCVLMWWFTAHEYQFGLHAVKTASLGWRGIARLLDLLLIGLTTGAVGWAWTRDLDWPAFFEALNLRLEHPTVPVVAQAAMLMILWLISCWLVMIMIQATCGMTPGKCLCGLKTVRTTLRSCGVAASLAREVVFFVDCGNFLWWIPGVLSIALTDRRQRLGDLVADTIVINARSLIANPAIDDMTSWEAS